jgi:hypothetical protein
LKRLQAIKLIGVALAVAGAIGCAAAVVRPPSEFPYHDDVSFRGFAEEALHGFGTSRTHRFDDYTKGSYHVNPDEVVEGLFRVAPLYKLRLTAVAVVGSYGPLWAYDVITVVAEDSCIRVNWLTMPHARITLKQTGCVAPEVISAFLAEFRGLASLTARPPSGDSCLVVSHGAKALWSRFSCHAASGSEDVERLERVLKSLAPSLTRTYSNVGR